jgi:hypothetical protein
MAAPFDADFFDDSFFDVGAGVVLVDDEIDMQPLKQSTAITHCFYAKDEDGNGVTGLVDGDFTKRIRKAGNAFAAMTVTITELENGWYSLPISAAHSDTAGFLAVSLSASGIRRVNLLYRVMARLTDDVAYTDPTGIPISIGGTGLVTIDDGGRYVHQNRR